MSQRLLENYKAKNKEKHQSGSSWPTLTLCGSFTVAGSGRVFFKGKMETLGSLEKVYIFRSQELQQSFSSEQKQPKPVFYSDSFPAGLVPETDV